MAFVSLYLSQGKIEKAILPLIPAVAFITSALTIIAMYRIMVSMGMTNAGNKDGASVNSDKISSGHY